MTPAAEVDSQLAERFWAKVERGGSDECWPWTASFNGHGYGQFAVDRRPRGAHRVAWTLTVSDPGDLFVLHRCDNRACCNPAHLFLGTQADNVADMWEKNRGPKNTGVRGAAHPKAKLTEAQVEEIRTRFKAGGITQAELARAFGVRATLISQIVRLQIWRHI